MMQGRRIRTATCAFSLPFQALTSNPSQPLPKPSPNPPQTSQPPLPPHTPQNLSSRQSVRLTEALAGSPRVLLSKLRELSSLGLGAGLPSDPLAHVRLPGRCLEVLRLLLDVLSRCAGLGSKALRCEMYAALLQYLHFCRWVVASGGWGWVVGVGVGGAGGGASEMYP